MAVTVAAATVAVAVDIIIVTVATVVAVAVVIMLVAMVGIRAMVVAIAMAVAVAMAATAAMAVATAIAADMTRAIRALLPTLLPLPLRLRQLPRRLRHPLRLPNLGRFYRKHVFLQSVPPLLALVGTQVKPKGPLNQRVERSFFARLEDWGSRPIFCLDWPAKPAGQRGGWRLRPGARHWR
jgi:hypothetical protein